jgi:hypothetical protein
MIITITLVIGMIGFFIATGLHISDKDLLPATITFSLAVLNLVALYTHVA